LRYYRGMPEHQPLTERELTDWERWAGRDIKWEGRDVQRLLAMIRSLQQRVAEFESEPKNE